MRVGKAMSMALDPEKPPLFGDEDLQLLPEERWERPAPDTSTSGVPAEKGTRRRRHGKGKRPKANGHRRPSSSVDPANDENGDPLTETDSDDDGDVAVDAESVSSSDSEFERFDLEESDEEGEREILSSNYYCHVWEGG